MRCHPLQTRISIALTANKDGYDKLQPLLLKNKEALVLNKEVRPIT